MALLMNFLGLGLGNLLMNDDAAGLRAIYALQDFYPTRPDFQLVDGGTLGLDLLTYVEWADTLLLLDAIDIGVAPGTVARIEGEDIDSVLEAKVSPHQVGMSDLLAAAELIDDQPRNVILLGIQFASINMEMTLSTEVEAGLPRMINAARQLIDVHLQD